MNERVLRITEYHKILERLSEHASSAPGKACCTGLLPLTTLYDIELAQRETAAAVRSLLKKGGISFGSLRDFSAAFSSLSIGAQLAQPELLHLAAFLENVARVRNYGTSEKGADAAPVQEVSVESDPLTDRFECLYPLHPLSTEIRRCLLSEEEMADDASPELKRIRRSIGLTGDKIHAQLTKMVGSTYASYLQDAVITLRGDRYCLPVKAEHKGQVPGIVHDQSSSGSTFFIEPAAIVELNNALRALAIEERREMDRILGQLSAQCAEQLPALKADAENMTALDFIFARGALALEQDATRPLFGEDHCIDLKKARHPLLEKEKVVPIDVPIGEDYNMIIITGPNTGGKTVALKTVGLLELMGMSGLHIPAAENSRLALFREVFADIGDEQSIEQSLSTFSSHMATIVDIFKRVDKDCLCLFDELGAGTDPTEGAALAISILNFLHVRGITALATTHYSELKVYAMRTPGVVNASCEFNIETLAPTYRLMIGVPGKSNAFAISKRLGLPNYIIETAREQLSQETQNFEEILADLEEARRGAAADKEAAEALKTVLDRREKDLRSREKTLEEKREKILQAANAEARDILQAAKAEADAAIAALRRHGGDVSEMERTRTALREKAAEKGQKVSFAPKASAAGRKIDAKALRPGDKVFVRSLGLTGTVHSLPDKDGRLVIQCGVMQSRVRTDDLSPVDEEEIRVPERIQSSMKKAVRRREGAALASGAGSGSSSVAAISPEINLLGMTTDEALQALDKYLDEARLAHLESVRIIHGKGTGALRSAVQNYLRKQRWITSYRQGEFGEGDAGVTILTL